MLNMFNEVSLNCNISPTITTSDKVVKINQNTKFIALSILVNQIHSKNKLSITCNYIWY